MSKPSRRGNRQKGAAAEDTPEARGKDVVLIHGRTEDGAGLRVLRLHDDRVELGCVRPLRDGQPISGEVVRLVPRPECPIVCDVESQFQTPAETDVLVQPNEVSSGPAISPGGPPQVATDQYRQNWDSIWSRPTQRKGLLN